MSMPRIKRPSPATVIAIIALIVAMGGTAEAVKTHALVGKRDIAKEAVTAKALAKGAIHPKAISTGAVKEAAISRGAVGATALAAGAVTAGAMSPDSITSRALAPESVYGGALGAVTLHTAPIVDLDQSADLSTWTSSSTATASCETGERVISGGVVFTNPGNRRVGIIQSVPFVNGNGQGWVGQITTDSGGTAIAEVQALCLK
jgi:hypothetical protein